MSIVTDRSDREDWYETGDVKVTPKLSLWQKWFCFCRKTKDSPTMKHKQYPDIYLYQCTKCHRVWNMPGQPSHLGKMFRHMAGGKYE